MVGIPPGSLGHDNIPKVGNVFLSFAFDLLDRILMLPASCHQPSQASMGSAQESTWGRLRKQTDAEDVVRHFGWKVS
jgi:hypothetical protein